MTYTSTNFAVIFLVSVKKRDFKIVETFFSVLKTLGTAYHNTKRLYSCCSY